MAQVKIPSLEQGLRDTLNAGLGLFGTVAAKVDEIQKKVIKGYETLVVQGAAEKGEVSEKLRVALKQGWTAVADAREKLTGLTQAGGPAVSTKPSVKSAAR